MEQRVVYSLICILACIGLVFGHGMMLDPLNRSSLWRKFKDAPPNWEDDELNCGGFGTQWDQNDGKCGVCGDPYDAPHPQANENTGKYGHGRVVRHYKQGSLVDVKILLTANHLGNFKYSICTLEDPDAPEFGDECFLPLTLGDGSTQYNITASEKSITNTIKLPDGFTCDRCVLRWSWRVANNWGQCDDGTYKMGCGPQETFRSCADIAIL